MIVYNNIQELPIINFQKVMETGDLKYLKKFPVPFVNLDKVWQSINEQIIDQVGVSEEYEEIFRLQRDFYILSCDMDINDNQKLKARINIKKKQIEALQKKPDEDIKKSNVKNHRILSEWAKTDTRKLNTYDYFCYWNDYIKAAKDAKQN